MASIMAILVIGGEEIQYNTCNFYGLMNEK